MNKQIELGLEGAFKVDLFNGQGEIVSTTDYFANFITPTGLTFPYVYPFADCFRYLSIGRSAVANSGTTGLLNLGVTGLFDPINTYQTSAGTFETANHIGWPAYATGGEVSSCGTVVTESGPRMYRAWQIPSGGGLVMNEVSTNGLNISEFMVSPDSGSHPTGKHAFSRVVRNLFIPNGHRAIVSYQLKISIRNTGVTTFSGGTFRTGNAEVENDFDLISTWANLSGIYRQVYHGLRCVDTLGMSYIPKMGDGMEPASLNTSRMVWYLSPDNSQFEVNSNGGKQTITFPNPSLGMAEAYRVDGLMAPVRTLDLRGIKAYTLPSSLKGNFVTYYHQTNPNVTTFPTTTQTSNIRVGKNGALLAIPKIIDYSTEDATIHFQTSQSLSSNSISYATPGLDRFSNFYSDFGKQAVFSSFTDNLPRSYSGQNAITGRKKTLTRKSVFSPLNSLGYNTRFGSLVFAFNGDTTQALPNRTYYPMVDTLFYDSSGKLYMPHYRFVTGVQMVERGSGVAEAIVFISGGTGINISRFTPRKTFNGSGNGDMNATLGSSFPKFGFVFSGGNLNTGTSGLSRNFTYNGTGYSGWGAVYGITADNNFWVYPDVGLIDKVATNFTEPSSSGNIYWPEVGNPNHRLVLAFSGMKYFDTGVGIVEDVTGWFNGRRQIAGDPIFYRTGITSPTGVITSTPYTGDSLILTVTGASDTTQTYTTSGYYLTTKFFNNSGAISLADLKANFVGDPSTVSLTGFVISADIIAGKLNGLAWQDLGGVPTTNAAFRFVPQLGTFTLPNTILAISGAMVPFARVTNFFSGNKEFRGYPSATGGNAFFDGSDNYIFFTGYSGTTPLYVTYVTGNSFFRWNPSANNNFISSGSSFAAYSNLTGKMPLTKFCPPTGVLLHSEYLMNSTTVATGFRMLPNFHELTPTGIWYPSGTRGGKYPALSLDNGLEVFLDISWSSPCGSNTQGGTCYEPI